MQAFRYFVLSAVLVGAVAAEAQTIRTAAHAGTMYPKEPQTLLAEVRNLLSAAPAHNHPGRLSAAIVPHSAYPFCGDVIAAGLKELQPGQYDRVIILAPGHLSQPEGCSIPDVETFATPLGQVFLDESAIRTLCFSSLYEYRGLQYPKDGASIPGRPPLHEFEYSIEVLLPFLQERIGVFRLVPVIVGTFTDTGGVKSHSRLAAAADALRKVIDARTLLIVSTDWTHYGKDFGFAPFKENVGENIQDLDRRAMQAVMDKDAKAFRRYLETTQNRICGANALQLMLGVLPRRAAGQQLAYQRSMDKTGNPARSISYAAINFYDSSATPPEARPERKLAWTFKPKPVAPAPVEEPTETPAVSSE